MASSQWSIEKNIQFISEYQWHECLWDPSHQQYNSIEARDVAYKAIMESMDMQSVREVINKIRILRNTYNKERKKIYGMKPSHPNFLKFSWLVYLDFINTDGLIRNSTGNIAREPAQSLARNGAQESSTSESDQPETDFADAAEVSSPSLPSTSRKKRKLKDPLLKAVDALLRTNKTKDEFDFFGQTVAQQLRQLPLEIALETEEMVLATIRRQRVKEAKLRQKAAAAAARSGSASQSEDD